jgi:protein-tyrosine phosphatase
MIKVLFVCLGNICRSPSAEGVFRKLVEEQGLIDQIEIDSAGTHAYHVGSPPDDRAQEAARRRGIDMSGLRGRRVDEGDFYIFDYVLVNMLSYAFICAEPYNPRRFKNTLANCNQSGGGMGNPG